MLIALISLLGAYAYEIQTYDMKLCTKKSFIPDESPIVSFFHEGTCHKYKKPINLYGTHSPLFKKVFVASGLRVVSNYSAPGITFNSCCKYCFNNFSNITSRM